jgi:hypothetical protein
MKNKVELVDNVWNNIGKNWIRIKFNLQFCFSIKDRQSIIDYLNNVDMFYKNWELDNVGHNGKAILLRGEDSFGNTKYIIMEEEL